MKRVLHVEADKPGSTSKTIYWTAESTEPIQETIAITLQTALGYDPRGYGFTSFECKEIDASLYRAKWHCSGSCD